MNRRDEILSAMTSRLREGSDRMFMWILLVEWVCAIVLAVATSPYSYDGLDREIHAHVWLAIVFGGVINSLPVGLVLFRPGWTGTRHTVAVVQMLWTAVLITITDGRVETHFHIFGSVALLALYRDWKALLTATGVVVADHLIRGVFWPDSLYGTSNPAWWSFLEHAGWVAFIDVALTIAIVRSTIEMRHSAAREARLERINSNVEALVERRTYELAESADRYRDLVENTEAIAFEYDFEAAELLYIAPQAARLFECSIEQLAEPGFLRSRIHSEDREQLTRSLSVRARGAHPWADHIDTRICTLSERTLHVRLFFSPVPGTSRVRAILLDITRQKQLELDLQQAQKLESVGRLAAGVAHEINTPIQFVGDSVVFMAGAFRDVATVLRKQDDVVRAVLAVTPNDPGALAASLAAEEADLEYVIAEAPNAADRALDGVDRVSTIVRSMKVFAHPDSEEMEPVDLNHAITTTLIIARNEYRYVADLETSLGELPPVTCFVGEVNQAVLNILINASHAISDQHAINGSRGRIAISTFATDTFVEISIRDTGGGIPDRVRERVFDPFFTTKSVGKGTGQGLSIARSVIVDRHKGTLRFDVEPGVGTTFYIRLPIDGFVRQSMIIHGAAA